MDSSSSQTGAGSALATSTHREWKTTSAFWAVPDDGAVSFRLDGVELQRLDDTDEGKFQFVPAQPPSAHRFSTQGNAIPG
jgi:hypothetical protein